MTCPTDTTTRRAFADGETLWLTFVASHPIKLRDIAPVEEGMGKFWRKRFDAASWPGLVFGTATESNGGYLCCLWLQSAGDRANHAAAPFVSDFAATIHRVTTALRAGALPAAEDCCDRRAEIWLVDPATPQPKPSVWAWPDFGVRKFLHTMKLLRVGIGTSISVTRPATSDEGGSQSLAPPFNIVVRGGEWKSLCRTYENLTRGGELADARPA